MATKKVSYITLLKEAMKSVQEFDSSQLDTVLPQVKRVLDYDGSKEIETSEKSDASSILERYYFREENDMSELEDEIAGEEGTEGTLEECDVKKEQEEKDEEEKKDEEPEEEKEVMEAYRVFKEQSGEESPAEVDQSTEEAGTKKDIDLAKEPAAKVGDKDITPNKEAGTLKEQDKEAGEEEEEVPETEIEEAEEKEDEEEGEEEEEDEEDAEKAVVEKLIAELEEEPEEEKGEEGEKGSEEDEKKVEEGLAGTIGGAALGGVIGGVPGAIVGGTAGHLAQKKFLKDQEEKDDEEEKDEEDKEKEEEPLDVDKKLKEMLPALPKAMANKNTEFQEAKLIKEAQEAIKYFLQEEEVEKISSKKDVTV